jgi:hypothetical protein
VIIKHFSVKVLVLNLIPDPHLLLITYSIIISFIYAN